MKPSYSHLCTLLSVVCFTPCLRADEARATPDGLAAQVDGRWWPVQAMHKSIACLKPTGTSTPAASYAMTLQSVAGLAAKAVNDGRGNELVWINFGNTVLEDRLSARLEGHPDLKVREVSNPWDIIEGYAASGIIKGYILYRADKSTGQLNEHRPGIDCSINVATSLAGILDGIIVDEALEPEAIAHGLKKLIDVRDKSQVWCFTTYCDRFNRRLVCTQDPLKCHTRDLAISQQAFTMYGDEEPLNAVMNWLEPLSPVLGWNGGDEFKTTELSTRWGHLQTATDWCMNLPVLMAGSEHANQSKAPGFDPRTIDWNDRRSGVCFVSSDGDNVQWWQGNFFDAGAAASYWGSRERGKIPFGWSCCFSELAQLCPETVDAAVATRTPNDSFIEWGGGYYYPDEFGAARPDRWQLLARQTRRTWAMMKLNNTRIIGFNLADCNSPNARKAYETIAGETDGLLAILVFQYAPYEGGAGKTFWVKDRTGVEVPVITARYSIWEHANDRERAGTPARVAHEITRTIKSTAAADLPRYEWAIAHVWSYFKNVDGDDENAEQLPNDDTRYTQGVRGYSPAVWCAARLPKEVRAIAPEEMAWRLRMQHNPTQTEDLIHKYRDAG